jgi:hypothetical protein
MRSVEAVVYTVRLRPAHAGPTNVQGFGLADKTAFVEESHVLTGYRRGRLWYGRLREPRRGTSAGVEVDWAWVLDREERRGDVIGFYHTHPPGMPSPSARDLRTMRAWVSCFGKPLLCLIESDAALSGYLFSNDEDTGQPLDEVQRFPRKVVVAAQAKENRHA